MMFHLLYDAKFGNIWPLGHFYCRVSDYLTEVYSNLRCVHTFLRTVVSRIQLIYYGQKAKFLRKT